MDYQRVGNLIAELRKEKGMTQRELSEKLGITDRAVSKWEKGLGCPDVSLLDDLSRILDISIIEILKGRRLDKDEIANNKNMIESMTYSKETYKNVLKKNINIFVILIILVISISLLFQNIKVLYYSNIKTYYYKDSNDDKNNIIDEFEKNIKLIKNNQGIYSNKDYQIILDYLNEKDKKLNQKEDKYYLNKKNYKCNEILKFINKKMDYTEFNLQPDEILIYKTLIKYNTNIIDNIGREYFIFNFERNSMVKLNNKTEKILKGNYVNYEIIINIYSVINLEYRRTNLILKEIIEAGDINE